MPSVLMINLAPEKQNLLQILSIRLNFSCRNVEPAEQAGRISDLLKGKGLPDPSIRPFHDEMLIMDGFSHPDLDFLLNELIRTGHPIQLKAVTTPTNIGWTVIALHTQLMLEHREMHHPASGARR